MQICRIYLTITNKYNRYLWCHISILKTVIMRRLISLLFFTILLTSCQCGRNQKSEDETIIDSHTSQNSLDYQGTYKGVLPCADCQGIEVTLTIDRQGNYHRTLTYLGKTDSPEVENKGRFEWSDDGRIITLTDLDAPNQYQVGENQLFHLDKNGDRIKGELADKYILRKQESLTE